MSEDRFGRGMEGDCDVSPEMLNLTDKCHFLHCDNMDSPGGNMWGKRILSLRHGLLMLC